MTNTQPITLQALNMATGLMQGDPASFKVGYTLENAHLAVVEYFKLDSDESAAVQRMLAAREGRRLLFAVTDDSGDGYGLFATEAEARAEADELGTDYIVKPHVAKPGDKTLAELEDAAQ